jgi:hypothetical protein
VGLGLDTNGWAWRWTAPYAQYVGISSPASPCVYTIIINSNINSNINNRLKLEANAISKGKLKNAIGRLTGKIFRTSLAPTIDKEGKIYTNIHNAHKATCKEKSQHFKLTEENWIRQSLLDDLGEEGQNRREAILQGTWRDEYPHLIPDSPNQTLQSDIALILDEMKIKVSPDVILQLQRILWKPVTYEEFENQLFEKKGHTTPGPSHVTYNMIKASPPPIREYLFEILNTFYRDRKVPNVWQHRYMALIPKNDEISLPNLRPIMLLETTRKIWLSIISGRITQILDSNQILHQAQTGCTANRGTEDAILSVINAIEDAHERNEEMHLLSFDTSKAFDSPTRFSGLYLAWRRIGLSHMDAMYIIECDIHNRIIPKTTYSILHPDLAESFNAECGTPQGDSLAGHQW